MGGGGLHAPKAMRWLSTGSTLTSPCPPSKHDLCTPTQTITQIKTEYWDRAGGGGGYQLQG